MTERETERERERERERVRVRVREKERVKRVKREWIKIVYWGNESKLAEREVNEGRSTRGNERMGDGWKGALERGRETIRSQRERVREPRREHTGRRHHRFHPLPIRWQPVMELQIRRHYMPLGNLWFRAQFYASTRPVTLSTYPSYLSLSLSLSLPPFHQNCFARRDILVLSPAQITRTRINYFGVNVTRWRRFVRVPFEPLRPSSGFFRRSTLSLAESGLWSWTSGGQARRVSQELARLREHLAELPPRCQQSFSVAHLPASGRFSGLPWDRFLLLLR